jgi:hypothetical protein
MGTFDDDPGIRPSVRQFVAYAGPWEPLPVDGLPRHTESHHKPANPLPFPRSRKTAPIRTAPLPTCTKERGQ